MIVPADCTLIKTLSNEDGQCSIKTGQLDGERSLKEKYATKCTQQGIEEALLSPEGSKIDVRCSVPDQNLFYFDGVICFE